MFNKHSNTKSVYAILWLNNILTVISSIDGKIFTMKLWIAFWYLHLKLIDKSFYLINSIYYIATIIELHNVNPINSWTWELEEK